MIQLHPADRQKKNSISRAVLLANFWTYCKERLERSKAAQPIENLPAMQIILWVQVEVGCGICDGGRYRRGRASFNWSPNSRARRVNRIETGSRPEDMYTRQAVQGGVDVEIFRCADLDGRFIVFVA
jgi:hypothetical protein